MLNVVMGLLVLVGSVVGDGDAVERWEGERTATAMRAEELASALAPAAGETEGDAMQSLPVEGETDWDVACERKQGGELVFDRKSVRELGGATLFRWSATETEAPAIYTAVVDCRAKTIEARWPGKRTTTRAGSCGRHLIEAVCATSPRTHRAAR
jgi:hypothetical protein